MHWQRWKSGLWAVIGICMATPWGCTSPSEAPKILVPLETLDMEPPPEAIQDLTAPSSTLNEGAKQKTDTEARSSSSPTYIVISASLKVRSGAGSKYKITGQLKKGDAVHVIQKRQGWAQIGPRRWVVSKFLSLEK